MIDKFETDPLRIFWRGSFSKKMRFFGITVELNNYDYFVKIKLSMKRS